MRLACIIVLLVGCFGTSACGPKDLIHLTTIQSTYFKGAYLSAAGDGKTLFAGAEGIDVWDLGDGKTPTKVATYQPRGPGHRVENMAMNGTALFYLDDLGCHIVDASDPIHLKEVGLERLLDRVAMRNIQRGHGPIAAGADVAEVLLWDVSDLFHPKVVGRFEGNAGRISGIDSSGDTLYVGGDAALNLWDISNREAPKTLGHLAPSSGDVILASEDVAWCSAGDLAQPKPRSVVVVSDPTRLEYLPADSSQQNSGWSGSSMLLKRGDIIFMIGGNRTGFLAYDAKDPIHPSRLNLNKVSFGVYANQLNVDDKFVYIAYEAGLQIIGTE